MDCIDEELEEFFFAIAVDFAVVGFDFVINSFKVIGRKESIIVSQDFFSEPTERVSNLGEHP